MMTIRDTEKRWSDVLGHLYLEHPEWNAVQLQQQLELAIGDKAPGLSAVQKRLPMIRQEHSRIIESGLLNRWHFGLMGNFPVSPGAVQNILTIQKYANNNNREYLNAGQVVWISRIADVIYTSLESRDKKRDKKENVEINPDQWVYDFTRAYTIEEVTAKAAGYPFDTSKLDAHLADIDNVMGITIIPNWAWVITTMDKQLIDGPVSRHSDGTDAR